MNARPPAVAPTPWMLARRRFLHTCSAAAAWLAIENTADAGLASDALAAGLHRPWIAANRVIHLHSRDRLDASRGDAPQHAFQPPRGAAHRSSTQPGAPTRNHPPRWLWRIGGTGLSAPSPAAWIADALTTGPERGDERLPPCVVLGAGEPPASIRASGPADLLPAGWQGIRCFPLGDPVLFLADPQDAAPAPPCGAIVPAVAQARRQAMQRLRHDRGRCGGIARGEAAFRMQQAAREAVDIACESAATRRAYGARSGRDDFASRCLLARRLVERGVRCVQVLHGGRGQVPAQPVVALVDDLQRRGLWDETLVVATTETMAAPHGSVLAAWIAGGGVRAGDVA